MRLFDVFLKHPMYKGQTFNWGRRVFRPKKDWTGSF